METHANPSDESNLAKTDQIILWDPIVMVGDRVDNSGMAPIQAVEGGKVDETISIEIYKCSECSVSYGSSSELLEHLHLHSQNAEKNGMNTNVLPSLKRKNSESGVTPAKKGRIQQDQENDKLCLGNSDHNTATTLLSIQKTPNHDMELVDDCDSIKPYSLDGSLTKNEKCSDLDVGSLPFPVEEDSAVSNSENSFLSVRNNNENSGPAAPNNQSQCKTVVSIINNSFPPSDSVNNETAEDDNTHTLSNQNSLKNVLQSRLVYQCEMCSEVFLKNIDLQDHTRSAHGIETNTCVDCVREFADKASLIRHMKREHQEDIFCCNHCSENFNSKSELTRHRKTHKEKKKIQCHECNQVFVYKKDLRNHIRDTHKELPLITNEAPLIISDRIVTNDGKYTSVFRCNLCHRPFTLKTDLLRHFLIHSGEKPFACDMCESRFNRKSNLVRHRKLMHHIVENVTCVNRRDLNKGKFYTRDVWEVESEVLEEEERVLHKEKMRRMQEREYQIQQWYNQQDVDGDEDEYVDDEFVGVTFLGDNDDEDIPKSGVELNLLQPDEKITVNILTYDS